HNGKLPARLARYASSDESLHYFDLNCCGTLNSVTVESLLSTCGGLVLVGCAARNCTNRDGLNLLRGRLYEKRVPFLSKEIDRGRIVVAPHSEHEFSGVVAAVTKLRVKLKDGKVSQPPFSSKILWGVKRTVATGILMG